MVSDTCKGMTLIEDLLMTIAEWLGADTSEYNTPRAAENGNAEEPADSTDQLTTTVFEPYKGKKRKPGTAISNIFQWAAE